MNHYVTLRNLTKRSPKEIERISAIWRDPDYLRKAPDNSGVQQQALETENPVLYACRFMINVVALVSKLGFEMARRYVAWDSLPRSLQKISWLNHVRVVIMQHSMSARYLSTPDMHRAEKDFIEVLHSKATNKFFPHGNYPLFAVEEDIPQRRIPLVGDEEAYLVGDPRDNGPGASRFRQATAFHRRALDEPVAIRGNWIGFDRPKHGKSLSKRSVVLFWIHGGGYMVGDSTTFSSALLQLQEYYHDLYSAEDPDATLYVFAIDYGLGPMECQWPVPRRQGVAGFMYLTDTCGIPANRICIAGDSAGANLTMAVTRALVHSAPRSLPGCIVPVSLWGAFDCWPVAAYEEQPDKAGDIIPGMSLCKGRKAIYGRLGDQHPEYYNCNADPYLSPSLAVDGNKGFPPILAPYGDAEVFCDSIELFIERSRRVGGCDVTPLKGKDMLHDWVLFPFNLEMRSKGLMTMAEFIGSHCSV
eukprot:Clim_evm16s211 gene=Clim_evmTU16s211